MLIIPIVDTSGMSHAGKMFIASCYLVMAICLAAPGVWEFIKWLKNKFKKENK